LSIHYQLNPKFSNFEDTLLNIEETFNASRESIHKARNELRIVEIHGIKCVIKSFKVPHLLNRIVYTYFKDSKAKKSYINSLKLQKLKIHTPEPIAYIEELCPTLHKSHFINRAFDYDFTIREPLLDKSFNDREEIFKEFARFTSKLHTNSVLHQDYSPGNILIKKEGNSFIFSVVDINRMSFSPLSKKTRYRNFSKLWADADVLEIISKEYSKIMGYDYKECLEEILKYDQAHKDFKNFKKKIKALF